MLSACVCAAALHFGGFSVVVSWAGTYLVHYLARSPSVTLPRLNFDPSYGVYIWAFPVQQLIAIYVRGRHWWPVSIALALAVTSGLATLSYFLIEKPVLSLKRRSEKPRLAVSPA